jgi:hypothetical protein
MRNHMVCGEIPDGGRTNGRTENTYFGTETAMAAETTKKRNKGTHSELDEDFFGNFCEGKLIVDPGATRNASPEDSVFESLDRPVDLTVASGKLPAPARVGGMANKLQ